jgi:beta-glucosidase
MSHGDYVMATNKILKAAYTNDICVLVVGNNHYVEAECFDRTILKISDAQERIIKDVAKINPNVVIVVEGGSAIDMTNWIDCVKAVVYAGFSGEATNEVITDILTGKINPSGKLNETFPLSLEDTPTGSCVGTAFVDRYQEGVFVGYRYYDSYNKEVLFPFGYGLSYSKFEYSALNIKKDSETDYKVSFKVKNISNVDGAEVCEVYVKDVFSLVSRPEKELKGFKKVFLKAGEETTVELPLDYRSFAYYSLPLKKWHVENGTFEIMVGSSSRNILLEDKIEINLPFKDQVSEN